MLWLPLQGATAAVLSVCVQEDFNRHHDRTMMTADNHHHDDCHKQTPNNATDHALANLPCDDTSCDAYSNMPILAGYSAPMPINDTSAITSFNSGFTSFVPEQPQRPPLTAFL
ncbi:MAG: hypothetical protein JSR32_07760 [Proteobacteria bacterium]|nr:hypothetical protein [Pseudomonadota bacterium]